MNELVAVPALVLFVYYAVAFTKGLVGLLSSNPVTSNWVIRLWALMLGICGAVGDYLLTVAHYDRLGLYTELKAGATAAVVAVITYHIGQKGFVDPLDSDSTPATATVTVGSVTTTAPAVVTLPEPPTGGVV